MNIFSKIFAEERRKEVLLGCPSKDQYEYDRRMTALSQMRGGNGFRIPPKGPKLSRGGKTRKELIAEGVRRPRLLKIRP